MIKMINESLNVNNSLKLVIPKRIRTVPWVAKFVDDFVDYHRRWEQSYTPGVYITGTTMKGNSQFIVDFEVDDEDECPFGSDEEIKEAIKNAYVDYVEQFYL